MKKASIIIIIVITVISVVSLILYMKQKEKINCLNSNSSENLVMCSSKLILNPQEEYDTYYNLASQKNDSKFFLGFSLAYNRCIVFGLKNECDVKNKEVFFQFIKKCAINNERACVESILLNIYPNDFSINEKIVIFNNSISLEKSKLLKIKEMGFIGSLCVSDTYADFYKTLSKKQKEKLPLETISECQKKG